MKRVLVIGGYGNFGTYISTTLAQNQDLQIIVAGRNSVKAKVLAEQIGAEWAELDASENLLETLKTINPYVVIHTSGPYQNQGYFVAEACIQHGCHYLDLADARDFVAGIQQLDDRAKSANVTVISGASSVPCLSSAVLDHFKPQFKTLTSLDYGIATAQQTNRGLATTSSILTYTGKPFKTLENGTYKTIYGWQNLHREKYPEFGKRWLCNCDIPDLTLFPEIYPDLKSIRFYAGAEITVAHLGLWMLSWLPRFKLLNSLSALDKLLLFLASKLDWLGTGNSAFHMHMSGTSPDGGALKKTFYLLARDGDGPLIPCIPAILLTRKLTAGEFTRSGAFSSTGTLSLSEYLAGLSGLNIEHLEY